MKEESNPPATIITEVCQPIIYPTPMSSGETSMPMEEPGYHERSRAGVGFQNPNSEGKLLKIAPIPIPLNIFAALVPPVSPAFRISAQAVPSGNRRLPCSFTIRYRL